MGKHKSSGHHAFISPDTSHCSVFFFFFLVASPVCAPNEHYLLYILWTSLHSTTIPLFLKDLFFAAATALGRLFFSVLRCCCSWRPNFTSHRLERKKKNLLLCFLSLSPSPSPLLFPSPPKSLSQWAFCLVRARSLLRSHISSSPLPPPSPYRIFCTILLPLTLLDKTRLKTLVLTWAECAIYRLTFFFRASHEYIILV